MKKTFWIVAVGLIAGCGGGVEDQDSAPASESQKQSLLTDSWEGIYGIRRLADGRYEINPTGLGQIPCIDGVYRDSCTVDRLSLTGARLYPTRISQITSRINSESAGDAASSVLLRGRMVRVRDHISLNQYDEFRATAVYVSPARRTHATSFIYVTGYQAPYYLSHQVNIFTIPKGRTLDIARRSQFVWLNPVSERPALGFSNVILSYTSVRALGTELGAPFEYRIDQIFYPEPKWVETRPIGGILLSP